MGYRRHPPTAMSMQSYRWATCSTLPRGLRRGGFVCLSLPEDGEAGVVPSSPRLQLYQQRWVQLAYLSLLALLSDWVCFSVAAAPGTWKDAYARDPATLIDIFLFTNVFFCFLEPAIVRRVGLRAVVVGAGALMAAGCFLRSGVPFGGELPSYPQVIAGTVLVGAAQPFFQCTPPLLSATWFGADERALATAMCVSTFNVLAALPESVHPDVPASNSPIDASMWSQVPCAACANQPAELFLPATRILLQRHTTSSPPQRLQPLRPFS